MGQATWDPVVAENLAKLREARKLTHEQVCKGVGKQHPWFYRLTIRDERDENRRGTTPAAYRTLAKLFDVSLDFLLDPPKDEDAWNREVFGVTARSPVDPPDELSARQLESPAAPVPFHLQPVAAGTTDSSDGASTGQRAASERLGAEIGQRIAEARERQIGAKLKDAAALAGSPEASLHRLVELAPALGVSLDWLLGLTDEPAVFGVTIVPVYPEPVAAGERAGEVTVPDLGIPHCFSRERLAKDGIDPEKAGVFLVAGESMVPTLADGGRVLVDKQRTEPKDNCLFVIACGDQLLVKRFARERRRSFWKSDNEAFKPIPHDQSISVQGQVRWSMRRFGDEGR